MTFFKPFSWIRRGRPRAESRQADVIEKSKQPYDEIRHLLTTPPSEEEREATEQLRRVWLANHEAGC